MVKLWQQIELHQMQDCSGWLSGKRRNQTIDNYCWIQLPLECADIVYSSVVKDLNNKCKTVVLCDSDN